MKNRMTEVIIGVVICFGILLFDVKVSFAAPMSAYTGNDVEVQAEGMNENWDGATNVSQFLGSDGYLWYAVDSGNSVIVHKTKDGKPVTDVVKLIKQHPKFGTAICDDNGNIYLVTGENNPGDNTIVETIFISKYDADGKHIKTVGDNGDPKNGESATKIPFDFGNCDAAINGNILTVNYARKMYNGHQSNATFTINTDSMTKVDAGDFYESHSFAQRVIPTKEGFFYMSEGDCFDRQFKSYCVRLNGGLVLNHKEKGVFDFWVQDGAFDAYDMGVVNNNFAHMGGIAELSDGKVAFAAQSVQSLNSNAKNESEEIFIQIFDPYGDLSKAASYITTGERSGLAGNNGRTQVTNHGVKWLTSYGSEADIKNVQIAANDKNQVIVIYELWKNDNYKGVYYIVIDGSGNVVHPATLFSETARLNPCEMPVNAGGRTYWVGNKNYDDRLYMFMLDPTMSPAIVSTDVCASSGLTFDGNEKTLATAGTASGGTIEYTLGEDDYSAPDDDAFSSIIPSSVNAGTYYVWYRVTGDPDHYDIDPKVITATIEKAENSLNLKCGSKTYSARKDLKKKKTFNIGASDAQGAVSYRLSSNAWASGIKVSSKGKVTIPKKCRKGKYTIDVEASGDENHFSTTKTTMVIVKK